MPPGQVFPRTPSGTWDAAPAARGWPSLFAARDPPDPEDTPTMPIAEITQSRDQRACSAAPGGVLRRPAGPDQAGDKLFRSSVGHYLFDCTSPGAATYLDLVASVGTPDHPQRRACRDPAGQPTPTAGSRCPAWAARNEVRVVADCAYASDGSGMHRAVDSADGRVYPYTNFEPADARRSTRTSSSRT